MKIIILVIWATCGPNCEPIFYPMPAISMVRCEQQLRDWRKIGANHAGRCFEHPIYLIGPVQPERGQLDE